MATHSSILAWRIPWQRRLAGYSPQCLKESERTQELTLFQSARRPFNHEGAQLESWWRLWKGRMWMRVLGARQGLSSHTD